MVRMAEKLWFGTGIADHQERINVERLRRERADKARAALKKHGVPAILAAGTEHTRYLTGLWGPEFIPQLWYVLFFAEHDPVVFMHAGYYHDYPDHAPWIKHWRLARNWVLEGCGPEATEEEAKLFADGVYRELAERGLQGEPLAVVGFDDTSAKALTAKGLKLVRGRPVMLEATKIKTVDEINCLKMAFAGTDTAWNYLWENLRPGVNENTVALHALMAARDVGVDAPGWGHIMFSGPTCFPRGVSQTERIVNYGDLSYASFCGLSYLGYQTCYYRTFSVGRPPDQKAQDWNKVLVERVDAVIDAIKPGATTADAARHFPPASKWGYKDEAEVLTVEIGHGIGLLWYGYPIINRQWSLEHPQVFEEGMTIAIEALEGEPGRGGVRLEDAVVVTKDGAELIDHWPRDEILVAPR